MAPGGLHDFISRSSTSLRGKHFNSKSDHAVGKRSNVSETADRQAKASSLRIPLPNSGFVRPKSRPTMNDVPTKITNKVRIRSSL